jgi:hypothetical protein
MITKANVTLVQGTTHGNREFGYVDGDNGGMFFTWMDTLAETLASIAADEVDGDGGLDREEVRQFLADYLPHTGKGRQLWGGEDE